MTKLSIIMPVRNEADSLRIMVKVINALIDTPHEIIVVTDNMEDTSIDAVKQLTERYTNLSHHLNTLGAGVLNAVKAGVSAAHGEYILIYAADEIGPVLAIDDMLKHMDNGCDFVSGTRYKLGGKRYGGSMLGHMLSRTANALFNLCTSTQLSDCTTGIKMFRKTIFSSFEWPQDCAGWSFAFHMSIAAQVQKLNIAEVPIVSIDRLFGGESSFRLIPWVRAYLNFFIQGVTALPKWKKTRSTT